MSGRMVLCTFALIGGTIVLGHGAAARDADIPWKINKSTAQRLAAEGFFGGAKLDRGLFEDDGDSNPPFFVFDGLNRSPVNGSFGFFAVNPWTGDVWNLWGCHKLSTPTLRESQAKIRHRFTATEMKQYAKLSRLKPDCTVDDEEPLPEPIR